MQIIPFLDWITATTQYPTHIDPKRIDIITATDYAHQIADLFTAFRNGYILLNERKEKFYAFNFDQSQGMKISLSQSRLQGVRLILDGQSLAVGQSAQRQLWSELHHHNWRPSRVDIAVDIIDSKHTIESLWREHLEKQAYQRRLQSHLILNSNGDTINVGSRKSDTYIRIYDKAKQQRVDKDWIRFEIEVKYKTAHHLPDVYNMTIRRGVATMLSMIDSLPESIYNGFVAIANDCSKFDKPRPKTRGSKELWLMEQVVPALRKVYAEDRALYERFVEEILAMDK